MRKKKKSALNDNKYSFRVEHKDENGETTDDEYELKKVKQKPRFGYKKWAVFNKESGQHEMMKLIQSIDTVTEWKVFMYLVSQLDIGLKCATVTQTTICREFGLRAETVSRTIKSLVEKNIVRKYDSYFALNPDYVAIGSRKSCEAAWCEAAERERAKQERIAEQRAAAAIEKAKTDGKSGAEILFGDVLTQDYASAQDATT